MKNHFCNIIFKFF